MMVIKNHKSVCWRGRAVAEMLLRNQPGPYVERDRGEARDGFGAMLCTIVMHVNSQRHGKFPLLHILRMCGEREDSKKFLRRFNFLNLVL